MTDGICLFFSEVENRTDLVDVGKPAQQQGGHRLRWRGAIGKDHGNGPVVLFMGYDLL